MYLAEDRILCLGNFFFFYKNYGFLEPLTFLGIFCQDKSKYTLKYIPDAEASTDAVDDFIEFMN